MDDSYTILRRFTPPTCTLEIFGKHSPLSRWAKKTVVKDVQFKLSFDDPRILTDEPVIITGNQEQLEQIYNLVLNYTESFLEQSFTEQFSDDVLSKNYQELDSNQPYLTPQKRANNAAISHDNLVNHQFNLGYLSSENNKIIPLSVTQLFDLVSALEEYKIEMAVLAKLEEQETNKTSKLFPIGITVAGIALAAGLTTLGIKVANQSPKQEQVATNNQTTPSLSNDSVEEIIPPDIPTNEEQATTNLPENSDLSNLERLPPPPAVDTLKPPPDIPDPALYPPLGNLKIPPLASIPEDNKKLETVQPESAPNNSQVESTITIPTDTDSTSNDQTETSSSSELENNQAETNYSITINPNNSKPENNSLEEQTNTNRELTDNSNNEIKNPNSEKIASEERQTNLDSNNDSEENSVSLNNSSINTNSSEEQPQTHTEITDDNLADKNLEQTTNDEENSLTENELQSKIPKIKQLEEIENYFQQKWRSQDELKQTLEYRLILNQNGSIKRIIPIGKASEIYLDRTNIPLMGEPFVSPLSNSNTVIRLLLSPDGEVRTFLE